MLKFGLQGSTPNPSPQDESSSLVRIRVYQYFLTLLKVRRPLLFILAAVLAIAGAKFGLINDFGSDDPDGDQWYGEVACTYAPWLSGDFGVTKLFAPHNEHRIVFTRLLDLALLVLNGQWDPRLQQAVDTLLLLAAVTVLLRHAVRQIPPIQQAIVAMLSVMFFGSAALWENTLNGFQSQFYFLLLFSLLHLLLTIDAFPFSALWWLGNFAGLCNLFSMAPGILSALAMLGWLAWRRFRCGKPTPGDIYTAGWNLALLITGWMLLPASSLTTGRGPATLTEFSKVSLHILSWPVVQWQFGLVVWAPAILFLGWNVLHKPSDTSRGWLLGLVLLTLLFVLAISVGRGGIASRYGDLYSLGILVNWLCLATWPARGRWRLLLAGVGTLWLIIIMQGLWKQERLSFDITLHKEATRHQKRADAIRQFLATGNAAFLRQSDQFWEMDIGILESIRTNPALCNILPFSIRPPLEIRVSSNTSGFHPGGAPVLPNAMTALPVWGNWGSATGEGQGEWKSAPIQARSALLVFFVAGEITPPLTELFLQTSDGARILPLQESVSALEHWHRVNFVNPGQPFQIVARDASTDHWLAFSAPLEYARGSWLTGKIMRIMRIASALVVAGWIILVGISLPCFLAWLGEEKAAHLAAH